ncbi:hypothetical protein LY78DRAFT_450836 [Colletotrichum sublineola]|nr:hypothetical protein LY78DRAFT_450836 [Colletotrichum sublineola]
MRLGPAFCALSHTMSKHLCGTGRRRGAEERISATFLSHCERSSRRSVMDSVNGYIGGGGGRSRPAHVCANRWCTIVVQR